MFLGDFFAASFEGFAEELVAGTTSAALFLAHRAPTILRAWSLRSSGVSFAQRALPPSDWIIFRCSRTVRSFLSFLSIFLNRRQRVSQIYRNQSFKIDLIKGLTVQIFIPQVSLTPNLRRPRAFPRRASSLIFSGSATVDVLGSGVFRLQACLRN